MREVKELVISEQDLEGRTVDKHFRITQMSAVKQERWINRVITLFVSTNAKDMASVQAILSSGKPENILGLFSGLDYEKVEPLYNELLECVTYIPDLENKAYSETLTPANADSIIADVRTLYKLRLESLKVNFGFFLNGLQPQEKNTTEAKTFTIPRPM